MIADSKEVQERNLDINLEPDTIEARVLKRPKIYSKRKLSMMGSKFNN